MAHRPRSRQRELPQDFEEGGGLGELPADSRRMMHSVIAPGESKKPRKCKHPHLECYMIALEQTLRNFRLSTNLPANFNPPWNSRHYTQEGQVSLVGGAGLTTIFLTPFVPGRHVTFIADLVQGLHAPAEDWNDVQWTMEIGDPSGGFTPINSQWIAFGFRGGWNRPYPLRLLLPENRRLRIQASNTGAKTFDGFARVTGWTWLPRVYMAEQEAGITIQD